MEEWRKLSFSPFPHSPIHIFIFYISSFPSSPSGTLQIRRPMRTSQSRIMTDHT